MNKRVIEQLKIYVVAVLGFSAVFAIVGIVLNQQFQTVVYEKVDRNIRQGVLSQVNKNKEDDLKKGVNITDGPRVIVVKNTTLSLPKKRIRTIEYRGQVARAVRVKEHVNLQYVTEEHQLVTAFQTRLLIIFSLAEIILLALSYLVSHITMRPIKRSWQQQKQFVADAAHELKTPMTIIQSKMERLLAQPQVKIIDEIDSVAIALRETRHLSTLTNDLLTLAKADSTITLFVFEPFDLGAMAREITAMFQLEADAQGQQLISDIADVGLIEGDEVRLRQLLLILLDNAIKYGRQGNQIKFSLRAIEKKRLQITISDTGNGIADKKHVFDRFYREENSRSTSGNGLGLAIAKWIVDGHHGQLKVHDNVPRGTVFVIELPQKAPR